MVQTLSAVAIPGTWIPAIPAGMTRWNPNAYAVKAAGFHTTCKFITTFQDTPPCHQVKPSFRQG